MIMTAQFYYFYTITKMFKYYFYPSAGGLETAMGYINEVNWISFMTNMSYCKNTCYIF